MIGKFKGMIDSYGDDYVILDVYGVGYQVYCLFWIFQVLLWVGEVVVLFIEIMVWEDMI